MEGALLTLCRANRLEAKTNLSRFRSASPDIFGRRQNDGLDVLPSHHLLEFGQVGSLDFRPMCEIVLSLLLQLVELALRSLGGSGIVQPTNNGGEVSQFAVHLLRIGQRIFVGPDLELNQIITNRN